MKWLALFSVKTFRMPQNRLHSGKFEFIPGILYLNYYRKYKSLTVI